MDQEDVRMMRYAIAAVIIISALIFLWPILANLGRKLLKHFKKLDKGTK